MTKSLASTRLAPGVAPAAARQARKPSTAPGLQRPRRWSAAAAQRKSTMQDGSPAQLAKLAAMARAHYGSRVPAVVLTPAPANRPVLKVKAGQPPLGVPLGFVTPTLSYAENLAQVARSGLPRFERLTQPERVHESAYAESIEKNLDAAVQAFVAASFDKDLNTHAFEVDAAKKLYEAYGVDKKPANPAQFTVRGTANHALHPTATVVARLAFLKVIDQIALLPKGDPNRDLFITNGGCAAGKSDLFDLAKRLNSVLGFGAVWDAAGENQASEAEWVLQAAASRGLRVTFAFAENDPLQRYQDVLDRYDSSGRLVDPISFAESYRAGTEHLKAFFQSPAYLKAHKAGLANAIGLSPGRLDRRAYTDSKIPRYPDARLMGDGGHITAKDVTSTPRPERILKAALSMLDAYLANRTQAGLPVDDVLTGAIGNLAKWEGSSL